MIFEWDEFNNAFELFEKLTYQFLFYDSNEFAYKFLRESV